MKEQQPNKAYDHDREHEKMKGKNDVHLQKHPVQSDVKKQTAQQPPAGIEPLGNVPRENPNKEAKILSGHEFSDLDIDKIYAFQNELETDENLRQRFQQDPNRLFKERGFIVPEGYTVTYDNKYVKPENGLKEGFYSYRLGNIVFTK